MSIGARIRELRLKAGLTQKDLAEHIGISQNHMSQLEKGKRRLDADWLPLIAEALGCNQEDLLSVGSNIRKFPSNRDYDLVAIPIVSPEHTACCGEGILAMDITSEPEEVLHIPRSLLGILDDLRPPYAERTDGTSMTTYGITTGAIVVINPAQEVRSGDVALICLGDDEAIKRVVFKPDRVELHSDSPVVIVEKEDMNSGWFRVIGKIVATWAAPKHGL